jgi:L-iditol 2-dehydrogenase
MVRRMKGTYQRAIALATSSIDLDALVTARFPLSDAVEAFTCAAAREGDKTVVAPGRVP